MTEETNTQNQQQTAQQQPDTQTQSAIAPVPYEKFKELNEKLKTAEAMIEKLSEAQKKEADRLAAEQGQWQKLAEQREQELANERTARLRLEVAGRKGIPTELANRLTGATAEEMEKDADSLLAFLKPKSGPGVPPATTIGQSTAVLDFLKMTPGKIREAAHGKSINDLLNQ